MQVSFEFFPPRTPEMEAALWRALNALAGFSPVFVSVTYGAGGSLRARTHATVMQILRQTRLAPAAHLTCVGETRAQLEETLRDYWRKGVRHIVALRGDMPDMQPYRPHPQGFASTPDFVAAIRAAGNFEVSVSAYPETHPDSASSRCDLDLLKRKIAAGADRAITQFCFDDQAILRLRERATRAGITIPIVPGIIPTTNFAGMRRMARKCGARLPRWLRRAYRGLDGDRQARRQCAVEVALRQCRTLRAEGFEALHFYTLNQAAVTAQVCAALGLGPAAGDAPGAAS